MKDVIVQYSSRYSLITELAENQEHVSFPETQMKETLNEKKHCLAEGCETETAAIQRQPKSITLLRLMRVGIVFA